MVCESSQERARQAPERVGRETDTTFRRAAFRVVGGQIMMTVFFAAACLGWGTTKWAYSAAVGGLICVIPGAFMAARISLGRQHHNPIRVLRRFYLNEVVKIALTVTMFAVAIVYLDVDLLVMFLGYVATTTVYWFALLASVEGRPP